MFPGVSIGKKGPNAHLRALGKTAVLGLGFGMGPQTFKNRVQTERIGCGEQDAEVAYATYVTNFPRIKQLRKELFDAFRRAAGGSRSEVCRCMLRPDDEGDFSPSVVVDLPTGRSLYYRSVRIQQEPSEYGARTAVWVATGGGPGTRGKRHQRRFADGVVRVRLTPQVIVENVVQGIARDILVHQVIEVEKFGLSVAWHHHDEIIVSSAACACSGSCSSDCPRLVARSTLQRVMGRVPQTLPLLAGLPVACEINESVGTTYSV